MKNARHYWAIGLVVIGLSSPLAQAKTPESAGWSSTWSSLFNRHSFGFGIGLAAARQSDLNSHLESSNIPTSTFSNSIEYDGIYQYRFFDSMYAIQIRPTYFTQNVSKGAYDYDLKGWTFLPTLKIYLGETRFDHIFLLAGIGIGSLRGSVTQPTGKVEFSGSSYGAMLGIGSEFCSMEGHCFVMEGSYRHLPVPRNTVDTGYGTLTGFTQVAAGREIEYSGSDLQTTMSGFVLRIGYHMLIGGW